MPEFALKGALAHMDQLEARADVLLGMGRPVHLELHTFGTQDVDSEEGHRAARGNTTRLRDRFPSPRLVLHVPPQGVRAVTELPFDTAQCERTIALAHEIGAEAVVLHRYYALVNGGESARIGTRTEAAAAFDAIIRDLARLAGEDLRLLVENIGHFWYLPRGGNYLSGPLDHFFPWEIADFRAGLVRDGISHVEPFVDVAHATLTSNLFNRRKRLPSAIIDDPRFTWITDEDLDQADRLEPFDFVDPTMTYLHVSDARLLDEAACCQIDLAEADLVEAITSEGLEVGTGNLPFHDLPRRVGPDATLVLEVEPGPGESHVANTAQPRSLERLAASFETRRHSAPLR